MRYFQIYAVYVFLALLALTIAPVLGLNGGQLVYASDLPYTYMAQAEALLNQASRNYFGEEPRYWYSTPYLAILSAVAIIYDSDKWPFVINTLALCGLLWPLSGLIWRKLEISGSGVWKVLLYLTFPLLIVVFDFLRLPVIGSYDAILLLYCGSIGIYISNTRISNLPSLWLGIVILVSPIFHPILLILSATLIFLQSDRWNRATKLLLLVFTLALFIFFEWSWILRATADFSLAGLAESILLYFNSIAGVLVLTSVALVWTIPNSENLDRHRQTKMALLLTPLLLAQPLLMGFGLGKTPESFIKLLAFLIFLEAFSLSLKKALSRAWIAASIWAAALIFALGSLLGIFYLPDKSVSVREISLRAHTFALDYFPFPVITNRPGLIAWNNSTQTVFGMQGSSQRRPLVENGILTPKNEQPVYEIYFGESATRNLALFPSSCPVARLVSDRNTVSKSEATLRLIDSNYRDEFLQSLEFLVQNSVGESRVYITRCQKN